MEGQDKSGFSIMCKLSAAAFGSSLLKVWKEAVDGWASRSRRSDLCEFMSYVCSTTASLLSPTALIFLLKIILYMCMCVSLYMCICLYAFFPLRVTKEKARNESKQSAETKGTT